ncbi:glycoside hydrolase family 12 protein [Jaapia argillacea MUCL 33604]|uniref:Glycoside hydrolase family 12 protein n=1 Tax=Jaapia argillacea MUCL 33604 TaxID=933084 RepID=A0A067PD05_9AGAM|nr:glycoside hydrolase family 12 protein [Jaapia argillacea MUCL 33604]
MTSTSHTMHLRFIFLGFLHLAVSQSTISTSTGNGWATPQCVTCGSWELCGSQPATPTATGSQTASCSGSTWSTKYSWSGDSETEVVLSRSSWGLQLSAVSSAPSTWDWSSTSGSGARVSVFYDIWLGTNSTGGAASSSSSHEVMIWLSALGGIQPVKSLLTSGIELAGYSWDLWKLPWSTYDTFTFVAATSGSSITSFSADLDYFFSSCSKFLISPWSVNSPCRIQNISSQMRELRPPNTSNPSGVV